MENMSDMNYIMIIEEAVADVILGLNKCILSPELKKKVTQLVTKHNEYKNTPKILDVLKQQEENEEQDIVIENQATELEKQQQQQESVNDNDIDVIGDLQHVNSSDAF